MMDGQKLNGSHTELPEVVDARRMRKAGKGAAEILRDRRIAHAEAANIHFIDNRVGERRLRRAVVFPIEVLVDNNALGHCRRAVFFAEFGIVP